MRVPSSRLVRRSGLHVSLGNYANFGFQSNPYLCRCLSDFDAHKGLYYFQRGAIGSGTVIAAADSGGSRNAGDQAEPASGRCAP